MSVTEDGRATARFRIWITSENTAAA